MTCHHFTKTGSGQTWEQIEKKRGAFSAAFVRQHQQGQQLSTPGKEAQVGQQQVRTARKRELSLLGFCLRCRLKMRSFAETGSGLSESTNLKNSATCHLCVCVCAAGGKYCLGDAAALRALPGRPPPCPRPAASTPGRFRGDFGRGADGRSEKRCFLRHFLYEHGHFNQGRLGRKIGQEHS